MMRIVALLCCWVGEFFFFFFANYDSTPAKPGLPMKQTDISVTLINNQKEAIPIFVLPE
jgi:hypothetical protein